MEPLTFPLLKLFKIKSYQLVVLKTNIKKKTEYASYEKGK